ncbi:MAG: NAD-dependent epimerase/dehydratase family protein [Deltaproteobacteria bacterium]|nr:NAD-dependent epimerase/dehydratase family protein [Deltaproteobacteria bacterium]
MPTAYVTGATGFLGLNLVEHLLARGFRVVAAHRESSDLRYLSRFDVERVVADVTDADAVLASMPEAVDLVFHVAGDTSLWRGDAERQARINVDGTRNVVDAALERRAGRFVHTSTGSVYGLRRGRITEESPSLALQSGVGYMRTKWLAEQVVREGMARGLDAVMLQPAAIVGPYDTRNWGRMIRLVANKTLPGVPPGSQSFAHVREVVKAHLVAAERAATGERFLLAGTDASYMEFVRVIVAETGGRAPRFTTPLPVLRALARLAELRSRFTHEAPDITPEAVRLLGRDAVRDSSKAVRELDYGVVPLEEMVRDAISWLRAEGLIASG